MGHGPGGLLRGGHCLGLLPARSRPLPHVPLGEDGLLGISDDKQRLCFALALWNGADPILKERLFGLTGSEGNHGEDVKEYYCYLDATPTTPISRGSTSIRNGPIPMRDLLAENRRRGGSNRSTNCSTPGSLPRIATSTSRSSTPRSRPKDILIRISATNRGPDAAPLHLLPTLWFRNTWSWGGTTANRSCAPVSRGGGRTKTRGGSLVQANHHELGEYWLVCEGTPELLFTENETNAQRLWGVPNSTPYVKDGIGEAVVHGRDEAVNPARRRHQRPRPTTGSTSLLARPRPSSCGYQASATPRPFTDAERIFADRRAEADAFYADTRAGRLTEDEARVQRQALAGLIWSKQYYNYDVAQWLDGDPAGPPPSESRKHGRNSQWRHHNSSDVISMPDKWEYPWYAAWDLAFHCVAFGLVDPRLRQGPTPAHGAGVVHAPERADPGLRVGLRRRQSPRPHLGDPVRFIRTSNDAPAKATATSWPAIFHKLLAQLHLVGKPEGRRTGTTSSRAASSDSTTSASSTAAWSCRPGMSLEQADGTAWMASYCLNMAWAAMELSQSDPAYEDLAVKFLEHYLAIGGGDERSRRRGEPASGTRRTVSTTTSSVERTASGCL